ncbi:hypothetical protein HQ590_05230, partial [bacterium]|nr:hypothetical protein [bacterium]
MLEVEPEHGALVRVRDKVGRLELITEPRLAESFRLLLPLPDLRANYILGTEQKVTSAKELAAPEVRKGSLPHAGGYDGLRLHWAGPLRNQRGAFALDVTLWVELVGEEIQFRCEVRNGTQYQLSEVWYVMLGGMRGLGHGEEARDTEVVLPCDNRSWRQPIFRDFGNTRGQLLGTLGGEHAFCYPGFMCMPWG